MSALGQFDVSPERTFLDHLSIIDRILGIIARRNALSATDAEEFAAWARARLMENDYAIIEKFGRRSTMATYLSVVLSNLFRDYRNSIWGRWRPSVAAQRTGPIGIRLEELLSRDGCSLREAIAILRSAGAAETEAELSRMAATLPRRTSDREVSIDEVADALPASAPTPLENEERQRVVGALRSAIDALPHEDRVILRMHFWNSLSVADIARHLGLEQKPLYRRLEGILRRIRELIAGFGVTADDGRDFLSDEGIW